MFDSDTTDEHVARTSPGITSSTWPRTTSPTTGRRSHSFHHPDAGSLEFEYQPLDLPVSAHEAHSLTICTVGPGTTDEDRLKLLAGWAATPRDRSP
ncbi:hypothetical protein [Streptomyces sp. CA-179760]|uniref:MmyB family transcriptional regulator n=1 Tax=Streptomyces sp. CA-179760 TaxID=3240054 RepID=UPI003D8D5CB3